MKIQKHQNAKFKFLQKMALRFETRDVYWIPQTHQTQLAEALIRATTKPLFRKALLQPPIQARLPDEKLGVATICTDGTDTLRATFYSEITINAIIQQHGPAHVQLVLHFPETLGLLCDQDDHPTNLTKLWGNPIPTPRRTEQFKPASLSFTTSAEYFQHKIAGSDNFENFYPNNKGNFGFIKPRKFRLAIQSSTAEPINFPTYTRVQHPHSSSTAIEEENIHEHSRPQLREPLNMSNSGTSAQPSSGHLRITWSNSFQLSSHGCHHHVASIDY